MSYVVQRMIEEECDKLASFLIAKNKAYGNSALDPVRVFSSAEVNEQIRVRMDDKLSRLARGATEGEDVIKDLMGYMILLKVSARLEILEGGWTDRAQGEILQFFSKPAPSWARSGEILRSEQLAHEEREESKGRMMDGLTQEAARRVQERGLREEP